MSQSQIAEKDMKETEEQYANWSSFLNNIIGVLAFTLALACLGTASPGFNAVLSLIFVFILYDTGRHKFPKMIEELREKKDPTEDEKRELKEIEKKYFGLRIIFRDARLFLAGMIFLASVYVLAMASGRYAWINSYLYGT